MNVGGPQHSTKLEIDWSCLITRGCQKLVVAEGSKCSTGSPDNDDLPHASYESNIFAPFFACPEIAGGLEAWDLQPARKIRAVPTTPSPAVCP